MTTPNLPETGKPFLRALKCAYKLHKAGLRVDQVNAYLMEVSGSLRISTDLPSAATPVQDILPATFNFCDTTMGEAYWLAIQRQLEAA